ncbi:MAG: NUDIX hydrolase [Saprospiraceae bacterium]|nr:NUDIX hydrolase [Saprospiraceae bacterium]
MTTTNALNENINTWISQINKEYKAAVSVDCVIFGYDENDLHVLLLKSDMPPFEGKYSLVGDLVTPNETLDESAERVLFQRTGLKDVFLEQVKTFSDVDRHPLGRVITTAYYSLVKLNPELFKIQEGNSKLKWKKVAKVGELAFDHNSILENCLTQLRYRLRDKPIGFKLLPKKFSLKQLQNLYEKVLDIELDKRNFRRKLKALDLLVDLNENQSDVNHRPAKLYSFDQEKYERKRKKGFNFEL